MLSYAAQMRLSFHYTTSVFHTIVTLSAPAGHLPLEWKAAIREYHPLKRRHTTLVNLSAPQAPSSRAQPRDLYCTAAICTHAPSLKRHLAASFFAFPSLTIYRFHTAAYSCASSRHSILRLRRGPFGLTGRRLNGQARRLFGLGQTRKSLCGTSVSKGLLVSLL